MTFPSRKITKYENKVFSCFFSFLFFICFMPFFLATFLNFGGRGWGEAPFAVNKNISLNLKVLLLALLEELWLSSTTQENESSSDLYVLKITLVFEWKDRFGWREWHFRVLSTSTRCKYGRKRKWIVRVENITKEWSWLEIYSFPKWVYIIY